jgi:hypothetical protein
MIQDQTFNTYILILLITLNVIDELSVGLVLVANYSHLYLFLFIFSWCVMICSSHFDSASGSHLPSLYSIIAVLLLAFFT